MKKKIAFLNPSNLDIIGGQERVLIKMANELANDYDVTIITYTSKDTFYPLDSRVKIVLLGLESNKYKSYILKMIQPLFYIIKLAKIIKKNKYSEVIGLTDFGVFFIYFSSFFYSKYNKFVWLHSSSHAKINKFMGNMRNYVYKYFDKVILLNKMDTVIYQKILGVDKVVRIPNPITSEFSSTSTLLNKNILSIGRLHHEKGFDYLIKAVKQVFDKHLDWTLNIVGQDVGEKKRLELLIQNLNLTNKVFIRDPVTNVQKFYINTSIFAMTSHFECLPLVLIEAAEAGLPLVAFNSPSGIADIVIDKTNGFLVERFSHQDLVEKLSLLIESYELRSKFGNQSKLQNSQFKTDKILEQWKQLLK